MRTLPTLLGRCWQRWPLLIAFCASLALSAIAVLSGNLNRDGMLYVEAANALLDDGFAAQFAVFSWPFLSTLMALGAGLSGLSPEQCGHLLNAVFMACSCALLLDLVRRREPALAGWALLVMLALPGLNAYRNELIREYGAWCFSLLALRLALDWPARASWRRAGMIQGSLVLAVLFRPETAVFLLAILAWQHGQALALGRARRALMLAGGPALILLVLLGVHALGLFAADSRFAFELGRFDFAFFHQSVEAMNGAFNQYARAAGTAPLILAFGSLALIPWLLLGKTGLFLIPAACFLTGGGLIAAVRRHALLAWALLCHLGVLALFVLQLQFLSGRYLSLLLLFATPFIADGLRRLCARWPQWRRTIWVLIGLMMINNVLVLQPSKQQFAAAGAWLAAHHEREAARVFLGSARTAHYAGWAYHRRVAAVDLAWLGAEMAAGRYDQIVLEVSRQDEDFAPWLAAQGWHEIERFRDRNGDAVVVAAPLPAQPAAASAASRLAPTPVSE